MKVTINFRVPQNNTYVATAQISEGITLKQVVKHILQNIMKSSIQIDEFYSDEQMKTKTDGKKIINGDQFYVHVQKHNYQNWFKQNPNHNNKPDLQGTPLTKQSEVNSPKKIPIKEEFNSHQNPQNVHDPSKSKISEKQIQIDVGEKRKLPEDPPQKQPQDKSPKKQPENNPKQPDPLLYLPQDPPEKKQPQLYLPQDPPEKKQPQNSIINRELPKNPPPNIIKPSQEGCCVLI